MKIIGSFFLATDHQNKDNNHFYDDKGDDSLLMKSFFFMSNFLNEKVKNVLHLDKPNHDDTKKKKNEQFTSVFIVNQIIKGKLNLISIQICYLNKNK